MPMLDRYYCLVLLIFFSFLAFSSDAWTNLTLSSEENSESNLLQDLMIVNYWDQRMKEKFPVTYNHLLQGGYFSMPSARMGEEGEIGAGYGYVPPYLHYNLRIQLVNFLELTGNYRIFKGVDDPVLTPLGFGDFSDKGVNLKLSLFSPEDSLYRLPGLAIGLEDFVGTSAFKAYYLVLTQVLLKQDLEISLGYGARRIHKWFGGMIWMPFRRKPWEYLKPLAFVLEYDAIPYQDSLIEKHPKGRKKNSPWHLGLKYRLWDNIDFSIAYIRGNKWAFTVSTLYNFGTTKGMLPKFNDPLPYKAPVNTQPIGSLRPIDVMIQDFIYAMRRQGFEVSEAWISDEEGRAILRLVVNNVAYRTEHTMRSRLNVLLASLVPDNIDKIIIVLDVISMPIQELHFETTFLRLFRDQEIGRYELDTLTPFYEVSYPNIYTSRLLFHQELEEWNAELLPKTHTLFGSSRGKFKYALGLSLNINGFIFNGIYYSISLGYFFFSNLHNLSDIDRLNPSQLLTVRTDIINYYQQRSITIDEAYMEKVWNWGKGWYTRITLGLLEQEYGGIATEWLYYPVNSAWAVGMEFALLKKRTPDSFGFTSRVRQLHGFQPHYVRFLGSQYFLNIFYDWKCTGLLFRVSGGKFLADDFGVRTEVSRYFPSGLRIGFWYTYTNANDKINNQIYHDKGIFFSVPLDIFYTRTSRSRWGYGMSAWLRDSGVRASTGTQLYDLINQERQ